MVWGVAYIAVWLAHIIEPCFDLDAPDIFEMI